jgi:hypothetical protein
MSREFQSSNSVRTFVISWRTHAGRHARTHAHDEVLSHFLASAPPPFIQLANFTARSCLLGAPLTCSVSLGIPYSWTCARELLGFPVSSKWGSSTDILLEAFHLIRFVLQQNEISNIPLTRILNVAFARVPSCLWNMSACKEVQWSEFLTANPEVLGSIPGAARFSE